MDFFLSSSFPVTLPFIASGASGAIGYELLPPAERYGFILGKITFSFIMYLFIYFPLQSFCLLLQKHHLINV